MIIPVYDVAAYLPACLDSVLSQSGADFEMIVIDDGSSDSSPRIISDYAVRDSRIRPYRKANGGQGAARNFGVSHARGEFLTFVDADDLVPPDAFRHMLASLKKSGSDFVIGGVRRLHHGEYHRPSWSVVVQAHDRIGVAIDDFPAALLDVVAHHRMFRREFWVDRVGGFPPGIYEDHIPMVAAYLRARQFDVLARNTYDWRIREDKTSTGQQKHDLRNLSDRINVKADAFRLVQAEASVSVRAAWLGRVLDTDFPPYIDHALRADDRYRDLLREALAKYVELATPEALAHVRVQQKVRSHLASKGAWDELEIAQQFFRDNGSVPATQVDAGTVELDDTLRDMLGVELPQGVFELSRYESRLQACALHSEWVGPALLRITGWAFIRGIDVGGRRPTIDLWIANGDGPERIGLVVELVKLPEATEWVGWPHGSFDNAGFRTTVDFSDLATTLEATQDWRLGIRVTADGVTREGALHHAVAGSSASRTVVTSRCVSDDGVVVIPRFDDSHGLTFTLRRPRVIAEHLEPTFHGRAIHGRIRSHEVKPFVPAAVRAIERVSGLTVDVTVASLNDGAQEFSLSLPPSVGSDEVAAGTDWELRAVDHDGRTRPVEWPCNEDAATIATTGTARLYWQRSPRGHVWMVDAPLIQVTRVDIDDVEIRVRVQCDRLVEGILSSARLSGPGVDVWLASSRRVAGDEIELTFPASVSGPGAARPLPVGSNALEVTDERGAVHEVPLAPALSATLPLRTTTNVHRASVRVSGQRTLSIELAAPLSDDEVSAYAQQVLRDAYITVETPPEDAVLFQCTNGDAAIGGALAIHEEVRRRGTLLTLYWGVVDFSTRLPDGARPLLIGSREWYDRLASVRYLCSDTDFEAFFRKRLHQRYLRIINRDQLASMGRTAWTATGYTPGRLAREIARRKADWDSIVVPETRAIDLVRGEFDYSDEVLVLGPNDDLATSRAVDVFLAASPPN